MSANGVTFERIPVPKRTGSHADALLVVGVADLLGDLISPGTVRIQDLGDRYEIVAPGATAATLLDVLPGTPGFRYLREKQEVTPIGVPVCEYEQERDNAQRYRDQRQLLQASKTTSPEEWEELERSRPSAHWRRDQSIRLLQGHLSANKLARIVAEMGLPKLRVAAAAALERYARSGESGLAWKVEQVQVFNPPAAKGYARLKPDSTDRNDGTSDGWCDPFVEWMRMRGYHHVALPIFLGSKGEHIRVLVPIPGDINLTTLREVSNEVQRHVGGRGNSEPKTDALAVLALTGVLVRRSQEFQDATNDQSNDPPLFSFDEMDDPRPSECIRGLHVTHYQSLGQSRAVGALEQIAIPGWFPVCSPEDAKDWGEILDEHRAAILSLEDSHSDEISILLAYRAFLQSAGDEEAQETAAAFLEFLGQYGCFLMRARERGRRARQFQTSTVRRVLMGLTDKYTTILDDPGFQAIAAAVRRATVSAQAQKAMGAAKYREIRYDLLPELRRKHELHSDDFMAVVAQFVSDYNSENAKRREQRATNPKIPLPPRNITTEEFRSFAALVEKDGTKKVVGALLCAYGTCREPNDRENPEDTTQDPPTEAEVPTEA